MDALKIKMIHWDKKWKIPGTQWTISGYSRSAYRTGFYIPSLKMMLDAGPQNFNEPEVILITHSHLDHIACLPFTLFNNGPQPQIYVPAEAECLINEYIKSVFSVNACEKITPEPHWYKVIPLKAGDVFPVSAKNTNLEIEVFACDHAIPTVSYGISIIKDKLRDELRGLDNKNIINLKQTGVILTEKVKEKKLAYVCDTSISFFENNKGVLDYKVIFVECTYFSPGEESLAKENRHIHWKSLKKYVIDYPDITFVLFHFSQRYRDEEILDFFQKEMEETGIKNIYCWTSS